MIRFGYIQFRKITRAFIFRGIQALFLVVFGFVLIFSMGEGSNAFASAAYSEKDLKETYLKTLENAVDVFEPLFTIKLTNAPDSGFYDFRRYNNWTHPRNEPYHTLCMVPGNGQVVLSYAVLLKYTDKNFFGNAQYPKEVLFEHARKAIRWICLTSAYVDHPYPFLPEVRDDLASGRQWKRRWGLRQDLLGYLSIGVALLWDDLDADTRHLFEQVATGGALRERVVRTMTPKGNGNHDQVKQDLSSTVAAAYLFPAHPDHVKFMNAVAGAGLDMVSTARDYSSDFPVNEKLLKNFALGNNLNPDYSSLHHNHPSLWYGVDLVFEGRLYVEILSKLTGLSVPETFNYSGNGFDGVYRYASLLTTGDGVMMHLRSPEYDCCYGEGLLAFCYGGVLKGDPRGASLEMKASQILSDHTRAIGQFDYHRGSWAKAAMAFLMHRLQIRGPYTANNDEISDKLVGTYRLPSLRALIHRTPSAWKGFVWGGDGEAGGGGPGAYVVPSEVGGPLVYNTSDGLIGAVLKHRPLILYFIILGFSFLLAVFGLFYSRKKALEIAEICSFAAIALFLAGGVIAWIDLKYTLPLRIPHAEIPLWPFVAVTIIAAAIIVLAVALSRLRWQQLKCTFVWTRPLLMALFVVPITILLMVRTPWMVVIQGENFFDIPLFYLICLVICILILNFGENFLILKETAIILPFLILVISIFSWFHGHMNENKDLFYLNLISIRNMPRIYIAESIGITVLLLALIGKIFFKKRRFLVAFECSGIFLISGVTVGLLSYSRFDLPQISRTYCEMSDNGFSTVGKSVTSVTDQLHAFFSFENGPGIIFLNIYGRQDAFVSYSGLPQPFYYREGFISARNVYFDGGMSSAALLRESSSNWWAVDNRIGMVFSGGNPFISGSRQLGSNWARTESYLDRMDIVAVSPMRLAALRQGQSLIKVAAGIYPGASRNEISEFAHDWRPLDEKGVVDGWMGVLAPMNDNNGLALAIANMNDFPSEADIQLSWNNWAPVFCMSGILKGENWYCPMTLNGYTTFRDQTNLLVRSHPKNSVQVEKINQNKYKFTTINGAVFNTRLRWIGPPLTNVILQDQFGRKEITSSSIASERGSVITIHGSVVITFDSDELEDSIPPFVEVSKPVSEADGKLLISVIANDQSNIANVTLYQDDVPLGKQDKPPYKWHIRPTENFHTFKALAVDASPRLNRRISYSVGWQKN